MKRYISYIKKFENLNQIFPDVGKVTAVSLVWDEEELKGTLRVTDLFTLEYTEHQLEGKELLDVIDYIRHEIETEYNVFDLKEGILDF